MAASREPRKQTWNAEGFVKQGIDSLLPAGLKRQCIERDKNIAAC